MSSLRDALPTLVPLAIDWARRAAADAASSGKPLDARDLEIASRVGVAHAHQVRVVVSAELPCPDHPMLCAAASEIGMLGAETAGLTLGHAIWLREGCVSPRLMSHELRHVAQYEAAGSIDAFLPEYLRQIVEVGYEDAPYEVDARAHEIDRPPNDVRRI